MTWQVESWCNRIRPHILHSLCSTRALLHGRLDSLKISHHPRYIFRTMTGDLNSPILCCIVPTWPPSHASLWNRIARLLQTRLPSTHDRNGSCAPAQRPENVCSSVQQGSPNSFPLARSLFLPPSAAAYQSPIQTPSSPFFCRFSTSASISDSVTGSRFTL